MEYISTLEPWIWLEKIKVQIMTSVHVCSTALFCPSIVPEPPQPKPYPQSQNLAITPKPNPNPEPYPNYKPDNP